MDVSHRDWAGIPADIVEMLVVKLDRFSDYVHFCDVCSEWRCVALEANVGHKSIFDIVKASRRKLPLLMFKTDENNYEWRSLYNVSRKETYTVKLPIPYKYRFVGSSLGWLFCVQENMVVTLVNPFNNSSISLPVFVDPCMFPPRLRINFDYYMRKGILSSDPSVSPDSFGVVVLYNGKLALFKSGESSWNFINSKLIVSDMIYYKDKLYAISFWGQFVQIDLGSRAIKTLIRGTELCPVSKIYLVESQAGELLMVKRVWVRTGERYIGGGPNVEDHSDNEENADNEANDDDIPHLDNEIVSSVSDAESLDNEVINGPIGDDDGSDGDDDGSDDDDDGSDDGDDSPFQSYEFKVFKMTHLTEESPTWVELNNIGEQALFVGDNHSMCVSTTDFNGCMPNSIYYTSEHHNYISPYTYYGLKEDCGVFNLEDGTVYKPHVLGSSSKYVLPPIWFVPNPRSTSLNLV